MERVPSKTSTVVLLVLTGIQVNWLVPRLMKMYKRAEKAFQKALSKMRILLVHSIRKPG